MTRDAKGQMTFVGVAQGALSPETEGLLPSYDESSQDSRSNANVAVGVRALLPAVAPLIAEDLAAHGNKFARE